MEIKELNSSNMKDWFDFFDNRAFADHEEWNTCYCTAFYYPKIKEYKEESNRRRDYAKWLIENRKMKGLIAYEDGKAIGWVNVNDKKHYPRLSDINTDENKVLSIVCFIIQKDYRRKGVAKQLLENIVLNAKKNGYSIIEAYPKKRAKSEYGVWNGPYEMYIKSGFSDYRIEKTNLVRKIISS